MKEVNNKENFDLKQILEKTKTNKNILKKQALNLTIYGLIYITLQAICINVGIIDSLTLSSVFYGIAGFFVGAGILELVDAKRIAKKIREEKIGAEYILDEFTNNTLKNNINITKKELKKSEIIDRVNVKGQEKYSNGTIEYKKRKVIDYCILTKKQELEIIRQITDIIKSNNKNILNRTTLTFDYYDKLNESYIHDDGTINKNNPVVKKLIKKQNKNNQHKNN